MTTAKFSFSLVLSSIAAAGIGLTLCQTALAQTGAATLQDNPQSGDNYSTDPFSGQGGGQANGVNQLIQRALSAPSISDEEFLQQQQESLNSEASDFRVRQQELLRQQNQPPQAQPQPTPLNN